jgi:hypothetical protein
MLAIPKLTKPMLVILMLTILRLVICMLAILMLVVPSLKKSNKLDVLLFTNALGK